MFCVLCSGGTNSSSMQMTSPEDELAIRDIEKQLLNSIENLPANNQYIRAEAHSPRYNMEGGYMYILQ